MNKINLKGQFEEFLQDKHMKLHPAILDDDLPDAYNDWISTLEPDDVIELAEEALEKLGTKK